MVICRRLNVIKNAAPRALKLKGIKIVARKTSVRVRSPAVRLFEVPVWVTALKTDYDFYQSPPSLRELEAHKIDLTIPVHLYRNGTRNLRALSKMKGSSNDHSLGVLYG